jgi:MFS transporter, SP family, inositol transporter
VSGTSTAHRRPNPWWVAVVSGMASYIDSAVIVSSGTALVLYQHSSGVTETEIGVLSAALTFSIAIGAITGGRLGDRFGRRSVFLVTMAMIIVGMTLLILSEAFPLLLVGTVLAGLGSGADLPVSLATIAEAATDRIRGRVVGFSQVLWFAGILGTNAVSAIVGGLGRLGGQIMFAHVGVVALVVLLLRLTIPESESWTAAHTEHRSGASTLRAQRAGIADVLRERAYLVPFLALLGFYALTNLAANTGGQFGTYVAVNVAGLSVQLWSLISLISLPIGALLALWFAHVSDGRHRMRYFVIGAVAYPVSFAIPAAFGFSLVTLIAFTAVNLIGSAFAFEAIMKIWTQESFPTLLRSSAQGAIIAFARVVAAIVALFTPALLGAAQGMYVALAVLVAIGMVIGWLGFRKQRGSQFDVEADEVATARAEAAEVGTRV